MSSTLDPYEEPLSRAAHHARAWLASTAERPVGPRQSADELRFARALPDEGVDPAAVVDELAALAEPGLMAIGSGRFYGWVMGGTLPAALGADWLVSSWDQNTGMRYATPGTVAAEETAAAWLLDLLALPGGSDVGFVTGGTMANFTCLAAARQAVLTQVGWDLGGRGLFGAPRVRVLVGAERHDTIDLSLRYLGLGEPEVVPADAQGRLRPAELVGMLTDEPTIVCLQAGNLHSGSFDPLAEAIAVAHARGAFVHVDGAFGLWAAASPHLRQLTSGLEAADSWATDAHKTLNVPYDCGVAIVAEPAHLRAAMGVHTAYLVGDSAGDPLERVPELSRRARGVPVWAALRSLGRRGVAELVESLVDSAQALADGIGALDGAEVCNDVVYTQVCVAFGDDDHTAAVTQRLIDDGDVWMSGSRWRGRRVLRISVSNWSTDGEDVRRSVAAVAAALRAVDLERA